MSQESILYSKFFKKKHFSKAMLCQSKQRIALRIQKVLQSKRDCVQTTLTGEGGCSNVYLTQYALFCKSVCKGVGGSELPQILSTWFVHSPKGSTASYFFLCEKKQSAMLHCALTKNIINKAILNKAQEGMGEKLMGLCNRQLKRCRKLLP